MSLRQGAGIPRMPAFIETAVIESIIRRLSVEVRHAVTSPATTGSPALDRCIEALDWLRAVRAAEL